MFSLLTNVFLKAFHLIRFHTKLLFLGILLSLETFPVWVLLLFVGISRFHASISRDLWNIVWQMKATVFSEWMFVFAISFFITFWVFEQSTRAVFQHISSSRCKILRRNKTLIRLGILEGLFAFCFMVLASIVYFSGLAAADTKEDGIFWLFLSLAIVSLTPILLLLYFTRIFAKLYIVLGSLSLRDSLVTSYRLFKANAIPTTTVAGCLLIIDSVFVLTVCGLTILGINIALFSPVAALICLVLARGVIATYNHTVWVVFFEQIASQKKNDTPHQRERIAFSEYPLEQPGSAMPSTTDK